MRKTKGRIAEVAEDYAAEIRRRFPGTEPEILDEPIGGYDVWVRVGLRTDKDDLVSQVFDATAEMTGVYADETGVHIIATPFLLEPAA